MAARLSATRGDPRDGWQAVDAALAAIEQIVSQDLHADLLVERLTEPLMSLGFGPVALWIRGEDSRPQLLASSLADESVLLAKDQVAAISQTLTSGTARILRGVSALSESSRHEQPPCLVAPWKLEGMPDGAIQAWLRNDASSASYENYLPLLAAAAELIADYRSRQRQLVARLDPAQYGRLLRFSEGLHASLDLADIAYRLANDGRTLIGCDRVAVVVRRGGKLKLAAVSGADHVHRRSEIVLPLETLCARVAATGEPFWYDDSEQELLPQLASAVAAYVEVSPAIAIAALPLNPTANDDCAKPVAVLVAEQYTRPFEPAMKSMLEAIRGHAALAIQNGRLVHAVPGWPVWQSLAKSDRWPAWLTRTSIGLSVLLLTIGVLFLTPAEVRIRAQGELQPQRRQEVFAPRDGVVIDVLVDHGDAVTEDQPLVRMRSPELDLELKRVGGELETTRKQLAATQAERLQLRPGESDARLRQRRLSAEEEQLQEQIRGLESREALLKDQEKQLTVLSPVGGDVLTWDIKQRLAARPLQRGDALLTVADPEGPWELELRVPSRRAGRLLAARKHNDRPIPVSFVLSTNPEKRLEGQVTSINERMEINELGESYLHVTVAVPRESLPSLKAGATAVARIDCGRGTLGEAWFHELLDAVRLWLA